MAISHCVYHQLICVYTVFTPRLLRKFMYKFYVKIHVQVLCELVFSSLGYILRNEIIGVIWPLFLTFCGTDKLFTKVTSVFDIRFSNI